MTVLRSRATNRSKTFGFCTISARKNEGQRIAAWATSPHSPQPTQSLFTCATGSTLSGSLAALTVSEGQPERRMQEWSPEHTSSSTPKRVRTTRRSEERRVGKGCKSRWAAYEYDKTGGRRA